MPKEKPDQTSTATKAPATEKTSAMTASHRELAKAQRMPGFNAEEAQKMFDEDSKRNAEGLGPEVYLNLDGEKSAQRKSKSCSPVLLDLLASRVYKN